MEVWIDEKKPEVMSTGNLVLAILVHVAFFLVCFLFARLHFKPKETVIPIDLTVVVNENLDGNENEPPPLDDPPPPPDRPKVVTPPPPPPPPPPTVKPQEAVQQVKEQKKTKQELEKERLENMRKRAKEVEPDKPKDKPKEQEKKPDPPKKTKEQILKERMEAMRKSATETKPVKIKVKDVPSGNGKTERQTRSAEEIQKLLNQGYKPGTTTQIAAGEEQRCISLIKSAFYAKWDRPPWTDTLREMHLKVKFGPGGRVLSYTLVQSSGDPKADSTVTRAAALVPSVAGLSDSFIAKNRDGVIIRFKVTPQ